MLPRSAPGTKRASGRKPIRSGAPRRVWRGDTGRAQLASAPDELRTRPTVIVPVLSACWVSGPPASRVLNEPALKLYVSTRPAWHFGRCGHSAGPPMTVAAPEHLAARSDRVLTPLASENAWVTANAFWSWAVEGLPKAIPALSPSGLSAAIVLSISGNDAGVVFLPFRKSAMEAAYSGTTSIVPFASS